MRRTLMTVHWLLITFLLSACTIPAPAPTLALEPKALYVFRFSPPALLKFSADLTAIEREIPLELTCPLSALYPSPRADLLVAELSCSNGPSAVLVEPDRGVITPLVQDASVDNHFLAWAADGASVYLRVDSLGDPHIAQVTLGSFNAKPIPITEYTYDLAASPDNKSFTFTFSNGFGFGSETWLGRNDGKTTRLLLADKSSYLSFMSWSPDGKQIAFIKIPDTQTPYTVGELWVMDADGSHPRKLAEVDTGHGYAESWSPDGTRLAFVVRSNPDEARADRSAEALVSNVAVVELASGVVTAVTAFEQGHAETPVWSPDGNSLTFNIVMNGRMQVQIADLARGAVSSLITEPACCPVWMRK